MIDRPQGVTVDDAARELECTIRTIWRDLGALQKAGFPLYTERAADGNRGGWRVTEDFKRALPLKLTLGELAALLMRRHTSVRRERNAGRVRCQRPRRPMADQAKKSDTAKPTSGNASGDTI